MLIKKFFSVVIILFFITVITITNCGCIRIKRKQDDGGVFKSLDRIERWEQKVFVSKTKKKEITIASVNVETMVFNPQDSQTIYIGTSEDGMYVTYNGGEEWKNILTKTGYIGLIAVDPKDSNIIYVVRGTRILKTKDGGQNWKQVYLETVPKQSVTAIAIDSYNPSIVYVGISDGRILKSINYGQSWTAIRTPKRKNKVMQILINPKNTNIVYVATASNGIFKSTDGGQTWKDVSDGLKKYPGSKYFKFGIIDSIKSDALIIVTKYGLIKTDDGGSSWQGIKLLTSPGTTEIYSLIINPLDSNEIYYGTASAIYKTSDGGQTWMAKSLPTKRAASYLLVDPRNTSVIYLGVKKIK